MHAGSRLFRLLPVDVIAMCLPDKSGAYQILGTCMATVRITKRSVDAARPQAADFFLWDTDLSGFGLKVSPAGRKSYIVQYRLGGRAGKTQRLTIGQHGVLTAEQARVEARRLLGEVAFGQDPALTRERARAAGITVAQALDRFFTEHVQVRRKARTAEEYARTARLSFQNSGTNRW